MNRTRPVTRSLYIEELERPAPALKDGWVTTQAEGEEAGCGDGWRCVTTLAVGEEAIKGLEE